MRTAFLFCLLLVMPGCFFGQYDRLNADLDLRRAQEVRKADAEFVENLTTALDAVPEPLAPELEAEIVESIDEFRESVHENIQGIEDWATVRAKRFGPSEVSVPLGGAAESLKLKSYEAKVELVNLVKQQFKPAGAGNGAAASSGGLGGLLGGLGGFGTVAASLFALFQRRKRGQAQKDGEFWKSSAGAAFKSIKKIRGSGTSKKAVDKVVDPDNNENGDRETARQLQKGFRKWKTEE